jgi:hypothetical protein
LKVCIKANAGAGVVAGSDADTPKLNIMFMIKSDNINSLCEKKPFIAVDSFILVVKKYSFRMNENEILIKRMGRCKIFMVNYCFAINIYNFC